MDKIDVGVERLWRQEKIAAGSRFPVGARIFAMWHDGVRIHVIMVFSGGGGLVGNTIDVPDMINHIDTYYNDFVSNFPNDPERSNPARIEPVTGVFWPGRPGGMVPDIIPDEVRSLVAEHHAKGLDRY